ncbi:AMP-binding protein, partial [bacterium]|nr:AMP-binding protein [bacterium]
MSNGRTLIELFEASVQRHSENPRMWEKKMDQYVATTYREAHEQVTQIAGGLLELGLASGDRVILLSEGRNDWVFAELAVLFCGAINVPVSVKLNQPNEIKFRCAHSAAKVAIVSARQVGKILDVKKDLPDLETVLCLDDVEKS